MSDRLLVLLRHGQSEWNLKNLFTGWKDPDLTDKGREEAREAGRKLLIADFSLDVTEPEFALAYEFNIVLKGRNSTPFETDDH